MTSVAASSDVIAMLREHYLPPNRPVSGTLATEVTSPDGKRRADAIWAAGTMSSPPSLVGHEIKVTRSDVLAELADPMKADAWARYCNRWWLVVSDPTLVEGLDIPSHWGVMAPPAGRRKRSMTVLREAPALTPQDSAVAWKNIVAWQTYRASELAWKQQSEMGHLRSEVDRLGRQVADMLADGLRRQHPHAILVSAVLAAIEKEKVSRAGWFPSDTVTPEDIAEAIVDLARSREALRSSIAAVQRLDKLLADPFATARTAIAEVLVKVGA